MNLQSKNGYNFRGMKTHIISIQKHDDITSAIDKMSWSKAPRILLVYPRRGNVLQRRVDLVLLQRYASKLGAQLGMVASDSEVVQYCEELGIPVFFSSREAQNASWRKARRFRRRRFFRPVGKDVLQELHASIEKGTETNLPRWLQRAGFALAILAFLAVVWLFTPSARVTLKLAEKTQSITMTIRADPNVNVPLITGSIPASEYSLLVEGRDEIKTTGFASLPEKAATGMVMITNLTNNNLTLPAGVLLHAVGENPAYYKTLETVALKEGLGETAAIQIQALQPGISGNAPAHTVKAIEAEYGWMVTVDNPEPLTGGTNRNSPVPNEVDYQQLRDRLMATLTRSAVRELEIFQMEGAYLLPQTLRVVAILEEESQPAFGEYGETLRLKLRIEFAVDYILEEDVQYIAAAALDANLPPRYQSMADSLNITWLGEPILAGSLISWEVRAERKIKAVWSADMAVQALPGRTLVEAMEELNQMTDLAEAPKVEIYPSFWQRLPLLPFRIEVVVQ